VIPEGTTKPAAASISNTTKTETKTETSSSAGADGPDQLSLKKLQKIPPMNLLLLKTNHLNYQTAKKENLTEKM
jgi:hypothetical protein